MADDPISGLPLTTTISGGDVVPLVQGGGTYRIGHTNYLKNDLTTVTASTYTVQAHDEVIELNDTSNAITVTLPDLAANAGRYIIIRLIDGSNGATINRAGSDTITRAGLTSVTLTSDGDFWTLFAGSTRWELVDGVESGSNSDGTWSKMCNGLLYQNSVELNIDLSTEDIQSFFYPIPFASGTYPGVSIQYKSTATGGSGYVDRTKAITTNPICVFEDNESFIIRIRTNTIEDNQEFRASYFGRWYV